MTWLYNSTAPTLKQGRGFRVRKVITNKLITACQKPKQNRRASVKIMTTLELRPSVFVKQFISRTASTGRDMYSVNILIDTVGGGQLKLNTFWGDMPYQLPFPVIKRIKNLVTEMIANNWCIDTINNELQSRYYSGFPKLQNCSDYERFVIGYNRNLNKPPRLDGFYSVTGRQYWAFHEIFMEKMRSEDALYRPKYHIQECGDPVYGGYTTVFDGTKYVPRYRGYSTTSQRVRKTKRVV